MEKTNAQTIIDRVLQASLVLFVASAPFSITLTQTALGIALLTWAGKMVLERKWLVPRTPLDYFFLAYLIAEIISLIFSQNRLNSIIYFKRMLLIPIVYLIAGNVKTKRLANLLILALITVTALMGIYGIYKYLTGVGGLEGRLKLFHHYMTSGGILMIIGLLNFSYTFSKAPIRTKIATLVSGILIIIPLIFTFTRSSWIGFAAGLIIIGILENRKLLAALVAGLVAFIVLAPPALKDRTLSIFDVNHPHNVERTNMWKAGLKIMKDYPLTGVGDIDLGEIYQRYKSPQAKEKAGHLHNNFITIGATLGVPGLVVIVLLFLKILAVEYTIYRKVNQEDWFARASCLGCLAAFVGFIINGLFEWTLGDAELVMLIWFTIGFTLALEKQNLSSNDLKSFN
ncbi:MAG: O-antigen ligase family protein, partial [candidate division KSB1 bacterium]|nr:O-antigen ligase family protein [candidate division KSB1 bacterium]